MDLMRKYNLKIATENIDRVVLKLSNCSNVEIRDIVRRAGLIKISAHNLDMVSEINEIQTIEKDKKFYFNNIEII